jgi:hypothetical protein
LESFSAQPECVKRLQRLKTAQLQKGEIYTMSKRALIGARSTTSAVIYFAALVLPAITVAQSRRPLALTNITVIDVLSDAPQRPATVLISNGKISGISSDGKLAIPAGAQVIDGAGKYLIPGLADMHNHLGSGLPAGRIR